MNATVVKLLAAPLVLASAGSALAEVHYVDLNSTNATPPYTNWTTAAAIIQDAVDAAVAGDEIVVTNGTYAGGVSINKPLTVRSVSGPQFTTIAGGGPCVSLVSNTSLSGFTVTGGFVSCGAGGGVFCQSSSAVVSNCVITGNQAYGDDNYCYGSSVFGGGAYGGTLNNCTLANNAASTFTGDFSIQGCSAYEAAGGGAAYCTLNNCTLSGNSASVTDYSDCYGMGSAYGGGAAYCTLNDCALSSNSVAASGSAYAQASASGGGAAYCTINACTVSGGSARADSFSHAQCAGAYFSTLDHCTLSGNWGVGASGCALGCALNNCALTNNRDVGANSSTLSNCTLTGNSYGGAESCTLRNCALSGNSGYGALSCLLTNCTLTGNFGGVSNCALANCITYFNSGGNYDSSSTLRYCCTTPMPTNGVGNISVDPQLASASHLSAFSPCIGKGNSASVSGTDIDGEPWANPPSIGCDEYHAGAVTGPLTVGITASLTRVLVGYSVAFTALIDGPTDLSAWDFGDGTLKIDQPYTTHSWSAVGDYVVSLWAFSDSYPGGITATLTVHVVTGLHYVAADSTNPAAPYASWATAATNIQDAIAAAEPGGATVVVVSNGSYGPINIPALMTVRSVNGPQFTTINGGGSSRCASLATNATLSGFTLTNGGGVFGGTLNNCALTGNSGYGASYSTLNNCALTGNTHGGADGCTLNNCTLTGNSASYGSGGASHCALNNCIVYFNTGPQGANYDSSSTLNYCCTTPQPTNGVGNISLDPQLANSSHLSAASPCRGAGNAAYASGTDIEGEAWLNPPSIGCDEYHAQAVTGPLSVAISSSFTNVAKGFTVQLTALIDGRPRASIWDFGDGNTATNEPYIFHAWTAPGDYALVLRAFNDSYPGGVSATVTVHVVNGVHYVAAGSANPVAPYTSWAAAATNIQDALDAAAEPGAQVVVTNGIYASRWRVFGGMTNRLVIHPYLTLQSLNGPQFTTIDGGQAVRCAYLAGASAISGFTLMNGAAGYGGGAFCESSSSVISNCVLTGNSASFWGGGGAYYGTLNNCTITGNSAHFYGGGAYGCALNNCILTGNSTANQGGGAYNCALNNCTLTGNSAEGGGGADSCTLNNCTLTGNSATGPYGYGGGAHGSTLNNCELTGNSAVYNGGGASGSTLNNCTLTGNSTTGPYGYGGGASGSTLNNCIVYYNFATNGPNHTYSTLNYCCTTPLPGGGTGNTTAEPQLVSCNS